MFVRARIMPVIGFAAFVGIAMLGARYASESAQASAHLGGTVYWSDGDSGRLSDGTIFRLHGVDAPETAPLTRKGGARCEEERSLGFEAKAAATELTRGHVVEVSEVVGRDRYGRNIVRLSLQGRDVGEMLVAQGTHRVWDYDGRARKPDWCAG